MLGHLVVGRMEGTGHPVREGTGVRQGMFHFFFRLFANKSPRETARPRVH
jgi:hypothetical protein